MTNASQQKSRRTLRKRFPLRCGPLDMQFDSGDLRYLRLGGREVIRRIYGAVRDRNWETIPARLSRMSCKIRRSGFLITYTSRHRSGEIDFIWHAKISGADDGTICFQFLGEARTTFLRNRIGLCVLYPIHECAGAKCQAHYVNGRVKQLRFPTWIAIDQPVKGFRDLSGISHEIAPGIRVEVSLQGDVFEMEDQRNWIDASFKVYGTPLNLPHPVEIKAGTRIEQLIKLKIISKLLTKVPPQATASTSNVKKKNKVVEILLGNQCWPLPAIGFGSSSQDGPIDDVSLRRLRVLKPAHIRVDIHATHAAAFHHLEAQCSLARSLGAGIELAIHLDDKPNPGANNGFLNAVVHRLSEKIAPFVRVLVFGLGARHASSAKGLALARKFLREFRVPLGGGSNADLYELNNATGLRKADFISWGMNPQVHAFDNLSIAEAPEAAASQVNSLRHRFPELPLAVSPVTLKPRFNATAMIQTEEAPMGELAGEADTRQTSLFGAAWTLAMFKALAESGADSITFYETTGCRGVLKTSGRPILRTKFSSRAGAVFPLYHTLADIADFAGGSICGSESSDPLSITSVFLKRESRGRLLLANLSGERRVATFSNFSAHGHLRIMSAGTSLRAVTMPEEFRLSSSPFSRSSIELGPHALATFDFSDA